MPYISQEKRQYLDESIDGVRKALAEIEMDYSGDNNAEGNLNYVISSLLAKIYSRGNYRDINDVVGVLECAKMEYYRKVAAPYEDEKATENGKVYK
jgi:hypothetical protein